MNGARSVGDQPGKPGEAAAFRVVARQGIAQWSIP
jgi:hypothetical protein